MEPTELLIKISRFVTSRAIGKIRTNGSDEATHWYCAACNARLPMSPLKLDKEKDNIPHKPDCVYLQARAVLLLVTEK